MFDFVTGSSTGAIVAGGLCLARQPVSQLEEDYLSVGANLFTNVRYFRGLWDLALFDATLLEQLMYSFRLFSARFERNSLHICTS